jgi:hypothetical protein
MKWIVAPLIAALFLAGSGFMSSLERTTEASILLAESSEEAPARTAEAAEDVGSLPQVADLTRQQAETFEILADALETSAQRVDDLNSTIAEQLDGLAALVGDIDALDPSVACVSRRLDALIAASADGPRLIGRISAVLDVVNGSQRRSIRHLKSINQKLAALGLLADATGVEPLPAPGEPPALSIGSPPEGTPC